MGPQSGPFAGKPAPTVIASRSPAALYLGELATACDGPRSGPSASVVDAPGVIIERDDPGLTDPVAEDLA